MNVLERTREIGVLRCIGARARDIRRIFAVEGLTVSLLGWLLGIPVGYALARLLNWLLLEVVKIEFALHLPAAERADRARRDGRARATDHADPAPAGGPLQAGRGDPLCMSPRSNCRASSGARGFRSRNTLRRPASRCSCSPARRRSSRCHAAVDSFIAPEPGTSPDDHLAARLGVARAARSGDRRSTHAFARARAQRSRRRSACSRWRARASRSPTLARSARAARTGPASCSSRSASCCSGSPPCCSGARGSRAGFADVRRGAIALATLDGCLLARRAARHRDPRDAPPTGGRRARRARTAVRAGHASDERRPRPRRLVRPIAATAPP